MARQSGSTMKVDVALPIDIFNTVMKLAEDSNAPIHHRSNQRVLSPTVIQLIGLGIQSLKDKPELSTESIPVAVAVNDSRFTALVDRVGKLEDSLKDRITINQVTEIARDEAHKATQPVFDELLNLKVREPAKAKPKDSLANGSGGGMSFAEFKDKHPELGIDRTKATATGGAASVRKALKATGLDKRYRYTSNDVKFHKLNGNTTGKKVLDDGHDGQ